MEYFNKYRLRRIGLYVTVLAIVFMGIGAMRFIKNSNAFGLDFDRQPIDLKKATIETVSVNVSDLSEENGYDINQCMMLINVSNPLPDGYEMEISEYKDTGVMMNTDMLQSYSLLSQAVSDNANDTLYVSSHVRTRDEQQELYDEDPETATKPGCSEHETGLALDVYVMYHAGEGFLNCDAGKFVNTHCHEYGFIIRYPHYGVKETGIKFEPWHIRYVGSPHSEIIYNNELTLEEYIFSLKENMFYETGGYIISRQKPVDGKIEIPLEYESLTISPDNTGCYIITAKISDDT